MVCAKKQTQSRKYSRQNLSRTCSLFTQEVGPNLHCDSSILQKYKCLSGMGDCKTVRELAVSTETQQFLSSETCNTAVWSPWGLHGPCEMKSKRRLALPSSLSLVQTRLRFLGRKERMCTWKNKRDSSEMEQNNGVSRKDIEIVYMLSTHIQFPQR